MTKCEFLPEYQVTWQSLIYWTWQEQTIKFLGATSDREVKIHCIRAIMPDLTDATNPIDIINSLEKIQHARPNLIMMRLLRWTGLWELAQKVVNQSP